MIWLFTDGACSGNPGPGAWAWILDHYGVRSQGSGYVTSTTNNRMELTAVLEGLKSLGTCSAVTVVSDSSYVVQGMQRWIYGWQANGWKNSQKKPVENQDLWKALIEVAHNFPNIIWQWVKGHGTHADNIEVDGLARNTLKAKGALGLGSLSHDTDASCFKDPKEWRPVAEWWIGDDQHRRGLWTDFLSHSGLALGYFQDVHRTIFLGLEWQKTCLDTVIAHVKSNISLRAVPEVSLTVTPQLEEYSAYEAYGFSRASSASTTWKKVLLGLCFLVIPSSYANKIPPKKNALKHAYLKSKKVYWRSGPGNEHPVTWIYSTPGWPVFIRKRWSYWCQIQDVKGTIGWVHGNLLAFRRIAFITHTRTPLRTSYSSQSPIKAYLQPGVLALCIEQHADWMRVRLLKERYEGWIHTEHMWQPEQEKHDGKKSKK